MSSIERIVGGIVPRVSTDPLHLLAAGRDLWSRTTLRLANGLLPQTPAAICWPETHQQLVELLDWASAAGVPIVPYGAGSGVCGGSGGREDSLVVDTKRMRGITRVDREHMLVHVEPGMLGQELEDRLERLGLATRHSPSSIWCSSVGGWAAARSAGQFSSLYGKFEDMVVAMKVATPTGTLLTGMHSPPGQEDLGPVIQGSEGTLGLITELCIRVVPVPEHRWLRAYAFPDLSSALEAMRAIMQADLWPAVMRLYDPVDTLIGGKLGSSGGKSSGKGHGHRAFLRILQSLDNLDAFRSRELNLAFALPRLLNRLAAGLGGRVLLILGWEGDPQIVPCQVQAAMGFLQGAQDLGAAPAHAWYQHRHDVSYKLAPIFSRGGFADTMEVASTWTRLEPMYRMVRDALARNVVVMSHFSHAYPEGCSIYFTFAGTGDIHRYDRTWEEALRAVRLAGGTVTHHHGVGLLKARAATRELGHALRVYRRRKQSLDPGGIMNPGRLFVAASPADDGPLPPSSKGPVFHLDSKSLLATVDPVASPSALREALAREGYTFRIPPDRPLKDWLLAWNLLAFDRHEVPMFGLQARFKDGCSARIGMAPRSAAGPDLRWGLLREAEPEAVEIPVIPLSAPRCLASMATPEPWQEARKLLRRGLRPLSCKGSSSPRGGQDRLSLLLLGPAGDSLVEALGLSPTPASSAKDPSPPRNPAMHASEDTIRGATAHHLLGEPEDA